MKNAVSLLLLLVSAHTAVAQTATTSLGVAATVPAILSTTTAYIAATGRQSPLSVITVAEGYLVVWADVPTALSPGFWRLRVSRVRADGSVVDPIGIRVAEETYLSAAGFSEGDGARIYWAASVDGGSYAIRTATVSSDGRISPIITVGNYPGGYPGGLTLAAARSGSVTALQLGRYVMFVDADRLVGLTDLNGWGEPESISAASGRFVSTWVSAGRVLMAQVLSTSGEIEGAPGGRGIDADVWGASAATDGAKVLITSATPEHATVRILDPADRSVTEIGIIPVPYLQPLLLWTGSAYLAMWQDFNIGIIGIDISENGVPSSSPTRTLLGGQGGRIFAAVSPLTMALVDERGYCFRGLCENDAWFSLLPRDASSPAEESALISGVARSQGDAVVSASDSTFFAVWKENAVVLAAPLLRDRRSVPIELDAKGSSGPALASNGNEFLATWIGPHSPTKAALRGRFFDVAGHALAPRLEFPVSADSPEVAVGASRTMFLVAWKEGEWIAARRIGADGTILDNGSALILGPAHSGFMAISIDFDGSAFVAVWRDVMSSGGSSSDILRAARVTPGGSVETGGTIVESPDLIGSASMRCGSGHCLLVWSEHPPDSVRLNLRGVLLRGGDLADESGFFAIAPSPSNVQTNAGVAWDGTSFVVTWSEYISDPYQALIRVATVRPGVPVLVTAAPSTIGPFPFSGGENTRVACIDGGDCAVTSQAWVDDEESGHSLRVFKAFLHETRLHTVRR